MKFGKRMKILRKEREMTLKELSEKSGVAIATLSRMEHNIMKGTFEAHVNICKALNLSLSDFYHDIENDEKTVSFIRQKERHDSFVHTKQSTMEMLTTKIMQKKMMPILIRIKPHGETHREENRPGTEKFVYMLEGTMLAEVGKEKHTLGKGDSLYLDASLSHIFINEGDSDAVAVCVLTPPVF